MDSDMITTDELEGAKTEKVELGKLLSKDQITDFELEMAMNDYE